MFELLLIAGAVAAGGIAAVAGFGIGSLLTPIFGLRVETRLAVAAVSIPHLAGTALRFWRLRGAVDRRVLRSFGATSAAGGLLGALLHNRAASPWLAMLFGALLLFVAATELTGAASRIRFSGPAAWIAGALSGMLGGLVGNQGGIRSGAMLGFDVPKEAFVATATAIGLIVDAARIPVYLGVDGPGILAVWRPVALATAGVLAGTIVGHRVLVRIPAPWFRRIVAVILAALGAVMVARVMAGR